MDLKLLRGVSAYTEASNTLLGVGLTIPTGFMLALEIEGGCGNSGGLSTAPGVRGLK